MVSRHVIRVLVGAGLTLALAAFTAAVVAQPPDAGGSARANGFDLSKSRVPPGEIIAGGPPRDGIRSVDDPAFADVAEARKWVAPENPVIGVAIGEAAFAYPVHLMERHQVVNQEVAGRKIVVTYDPLTDAAIAFDARVGEDALQFGVSGLVYHSNFLLYDRASESLWSQMLGRAITGRHAGAQLSRIRTRVEPLGSWLARHPASRVLERPELEKIDYRYSPYSAYWVASELVFPVPARDDRFHPKEVVLGVESKTEAGPKPAGDGASRAYLGSILSAAGGRVVDEFAGHKIRITYDGDTGTFLWEAPDALQVTSAYWFAWKAFHPDTTIWNEPAATPATEPLAPAEP